MTPNALSELAPRLKSVFGNWSAYLLVGSFFLYVLGYLVLRFHMTALGIGADLTIVDERYLFAGAQFVVYLIAVLVSVFFIAFVAAVLLYPLYRLAKRLRPDSKQKGEFQSTYLLPMLAIICALVMIQLVTRKLFLFSDLLFSSRRDIQETSWLAGLFLPEGSSMLELYFLGLVAACVVTTAILLLALYQGPVSARLRIVLGALGFLVLVQWLMVPINYGYMVVNKTLPRVASIDNSLPLEPGTRAWLAWQSNDSLTYFVLRCDGGNPERSLVTIRRKDGARIEIVGYDQILDLLNPETPVAASGQKKK